MIKHYPYFTKTADFLEGKSFLFKKPFERIRALGPNYEWAEDLCYRAFLLSGNDWPTYFKHVETLIPFSFEFLRLQTLLEKTGTYLYATFEEVEREVYNHAGNLTHGAPYIWALYFSQVFWESHHEIFKFFISDFATINMNKGRVLEVPLGTGVLSTHFLSRNHTWTGVGIDLSDTAIDFTKQLLTAHGLLRRMDLKRQDLFTYTENNESFDRIICGEFLEHVEKPVRVLEKLHELLAHNGKIFLSVAVYAAAIDHIYLYQSAEEVRAHIHDARLEIEKEFIQNISPRAKPEDRKTPLNYCAILTRRS